MRSLHPFLFLTEIKSAVEKRNHSWISSLCWMIFTIFSHLLSVLLSPSFPKSPIQTPPHPTRHFLLALLLLVSSRCHANFPGDGVVMVTECRADQLMSVVLLACVQMNKLFIFLFWSFDLVLQLSGHYEAQTLNMALNTWTSEAH